MVPTAKESSGCSTCSHDFIQIVSCQLSRACLTIVTRKVSDQMTSRRLMLGFMLLLHAAFSLLGNAGTHSLLGCQHDHGSHVTGSPLESVPHSHRGCQHAHCHSHHDPETPDSAPHSLPPLTDDGCAICQFFICPVDAVVAFEWAPRIEDLTVVAVEVAFQPGIEFESVYEVRGPPALA